MHQYEIFIVIICLASAFAYINHRFIKWPPTIGIMVLSLATSVLMLTGAKLFPQQSAGFIAIVTALDFRTILLDGMLAFMLFAASVHLDANALKKERLPVLALSTAGVVISTFIIGSLLFWLLGISGLQVAYIYCLLFAALISPTDPIAVLAILKQAGLKKSLELKIAGESLFNDGVAVVVFLTILEVALTGTDKLSAADISLLFLKEAGGGLLFGVALGYVAYLTIRTIDKYDVEILISIATVMGGYALANRLHCSGPLAMVAAGIVMGQKNDQGAISSTTRDYFNKFWELADEILNAILFLLMGFEMLVINTDMSTIVIGISCIAIVLFARWVSVAIPVTLLRIRVPFERHAIAILTWGGLRGGLSIALALSLPAQMHRDLFVSITYIVVIFSVVVQGLSIGPLYRKLNK